MDVTRLRRLLQEVDEEHHDTLGTALDGLAEVALGERTAQSRRALLRGSLVTAGASALVLGPLASVARADDTTTTAAPRVPDDADLDLLAYLQSLELAAGEVYDSAVAGGHLSAPMVDVATTFKRHHADHAHAIGGLAGKAARSAVNATVNKSFSGRALRSGTEAEALGVAFELENAVAATYAYMISVIRGTNPAAVLSSIQSIEARHAVFLGTVIGKSLDDYALMFEPNELRSALDPAKNPIEG